MTYKQKHVCELLLDMAERIGSHRETLHSLLVEYPSAIGFNRRRVCSDEVMLGVWGLSFLIDKYRIAFVYTGSDSGGDESGSAWGIKLFYGDTWHDLYLKLKKIDDEFL